VVDDAIVVLENVERIMREEHRQARDAAVKATEGLHPIIAIVLTLCGVRADRLLAASRASSTASSRSRSPLRW
jgi:hypothetical protein